MEKIPASKFKATCSAVLERVRRTRKPVLITKDGEPLAQIVPAPRAKRSKRKLGEMAGTARILGDIVSPATDELDWEALR